MVNTQPDVQPKTARFGWWILVVVSAVFGLNGVFWAFFGPDASLSSMADDMGLSATDLEGAYPLVADSITQEVRRVAVYLTAIGAMGFVAALAGLRRGVRLAWYITWLLIATMIALFLVGVSGGLGVFGVGNLVLAVIGLTGQLLARRASS